MTNEQQPDHQDVNWDEQIDFLRGLAHIVKDGRLSELSVEADGARVHLKGTPPQVVLATSTVGEGAATEGKKSESGAAPVVSPMVGVFYRTPSPADPPFIEVGDTVHAGQVIGVVEAMKVFNEITCDIEGIVTEIVAQNAELVETGQTLILVKKS